MDPQPTVSPYELDDGAVYDRVIEEFGAEALTANHRLRFPDPVHPLVRRDVFYAGRDLDRVLAAIDRERRVSVVTGVGPSGPMHLGHVFPLYFAKYLQQAAGAHVVVPVSDDEKYFTRDLDLAAVHRHLRDNLRDVLAVGFDPDRTTIVIDTADAELLYPVATDLAGRVTANTVEAIYGSPANPGEAFYPAMQATHLLLPQLLDGPHPTLVPVAVDQDPHVRLARDLAGMADVAATKPAALLAHFLPSLSGDGKLSSSDDAPTIELTDDPETVRETIMTHAYSGGRSSVEAHRKHGGNPAEDVSYRLLAAMFEPDDDRLDRIASQYRSGELLSGELKAIAVDRITDFLADHQRRRATLDDDLAAAIAPYRPTDEDRNRLSASPLESTKPT